MLVPILDPQATKKKPALSPDETGKEKQEPESLNEGQSREQQPVTDKDKEDGNEKGEIGKSNINKEFVVVRILEDMATFKAMDNRNYTLHAEDVVVLPGLNAKGLVKRNVAQIIL
ncbi:MAG: hypothetical protein R2741_12405 [Methanolobus sp.]